jgi:hypothetical protein
VSQTLIDPGLGTIIGTFNIRPEATFDGDTDQSVSEGGIEYANGNDVKLGKDWGEGNSHIVNGFKFFGPNNTGIESGGSSTITVTLYGSDDDFAASDVELGGAAITDQTGAVVSKLSGIDTSTGYRYHRVNVHTSDVFYPGNECNCAELQFFEDIPDFVAHTPHTQLGPILAQCRAIGRGFTGWRRRRGLLVPEFIMRDALA